LVFIIVYNSSKLNLYNIKKKSSIKGVQFYEKKLL